MNDKTLINIGRYVVNVAPVIFFCATVVMCIGVQDIISTTTKENAQLSKRLTASDLKRSEAEKQLAANTVTPQAPGIVIISPDGSTLKTFDPPRALSSFQRDIAF